MTEIFVDGFRTIAVANGVVRIELVQLRCGESKTSLEPEVVGTLMLPIPSLKGITGQLSSTLQKLNQAGRTRAQAGGNDDADKALQNL